MATFCKEKLENYGHHHMNNLSYWKRQKSLKVLQNFVRFWQFPYWFHPHYFRLNCILSSDDNGSFKTFLSPHNCHIGLATPRFLNREDRPTPVWLLWSDIPTTHYTSPTLHCPYPQPPLKHYLNVLIAPSWSISCSVSSGIVPGCWPSPPPPAPWCWV